MIKQWLILSAALFLVILAGCGSEKDRDINKNKDKPKAGTQS